MVNENVGLFGIEVFANVFKMRSHWIRVGPSPIVGGLIRRNLGSDTQGGCHMTMEADIRVILP